MYKQIKNVLNGIVKMSIGIPKEYNPPKIQKAPGSGIMLLMRSTSSSLDQYSSN